MFSQKATLTIVSGPNEGDTVRLEAGSCRLIGRHLSDNETIMIDIKGQRTLSGEATRILTEHLKDRAPVSASKQAASFSMETFSRGPDIILADDSVSRAHAMVFFDDKGLGVVDLASTNGTFVNDNRVGSMIISEGDNITIGKSTLSFKQK